MNKLLLTIDRVNTRIGQFFGWLALGLTLFVSYEVIARYVFGNPSSWAYDIMNMLYGTMFMMAGAYTLAKNGHVRGDVLYGFFPPRLQAGLDITLYFLFFFPGVIALAWAGWYYAAESWAINESSNLTADGPPIYPFKFIIPLAGICLLLQGVVEVAQCIKCLKQGAWPRRDEDVEEVNVEKFKEMVHAEDTDMQQLDKIVMQQERNRNHAEGRT